jgi:ankyrin repeat protein
MSRTLTPDSSLENLRKEAKRWLKALRGGDAQARLLAITPAAPADLALRDIQFALAREFGFPGWKALRQGLDNQAPARRSHMERVDMVLRSATWQGDRITASRILARWPEISAANLYAALSTGNLAEVERRLAADPVAATRRGGPLDREPLLYFSYARLPGGELDGLEIARALLDHGADANARWVGEWGEPAFTVLTGVIGEGEGDQPPHSRAKELAALLIDRGADIDRPTTLYDGPMGFASHFDRREIAAFLAPLSRDVHNLTYLGFKERLGELFVADPSLVNARHFRFGCTPLFVLPADEDDAIEMAAFLLAHGADPNIRGEDGMTAEQGLRQHGWIDLANFLRDESAKRVGARSVANLQGRRQNGANGTD